MKIPQVVCYSIKRVDQNKLWKILQEMGIPHHLTCLLRNLYAGQETTVRTGHETTDRFQVVKGIHQGCILSPCLYNLYEEYIMRNWEILRWMKHKLESKLPGKISITSVCRWHHPYGRKWRGTKEPLNESERGKGKKTKIMASGPITSWQVDGETMETVSDFIFWGSKITADGDCSYEIKRCLLHEG